MTWAVEGTTEFEEWFASLDAGNRRKVVAAIEMLRRTGPALGRLLVDTIASSRFANMKELRPPASNMRVLFAFDPTRRAVLLLGGDKTNRWDLWYREAVPRADAIFARVLRELGRSGEEQR